jgi:hypothetical protein
MENKVENQQPSLYEFVTQEEQNYRTERVPLASNWRDWNMYEHIDRSFTLKNSRFYKGAQDYKRPFNNIIIPIANVNYRSEGFDVKDIQIYVDDSENYHKSFIARKFNNWWAKENHIDTAIDESVESYFDYGLALLRNVNEARPEVIQLQQIAFCDQTDVMSGPICLKHHYTISELLDMKGKWDGKEIDKVVMMARFSKSQDQSYDQETKTPGKYLEVYDLEGMFPESWLGAEKLGEEWQDTGKYVYSRYMITYFVSPTDGKSKVGVCLFKGKAKSSYKSIKRDPIFGRACGRGGIEELFHPQIWTNYSELQIQQMLEATSKVILLTTDKKLKNQKFTDMKHGQVLDLTEGTRFEQLALQPINKTAFDNYVNKWEQVARTIGSASDPALGLNPVSGTPLGTTEIVTSQGIGIHEYRQGKMAEFWAEIYRDWVLPKCVDEINKGSKWLDDLSLDELQEVAEKVSVKQGNERIKEMVLSGKMMAPEEAEMMRGIIKEQFMKGGSKRFLEAVKDELKDLPTDVEISISNKQKNMAEVVSKLNSVFRTLFTPGAIQAIQANKGLSDLLNNILESGGLSPVNFASFTGQPQISPMQPPTMQPQMAQQPQLQANQQM